MNNLKFSHILISLLIIVTSGTVFYHHVEGWSWLDSYFFTIVTLSTVGYGSLVPATALGKIGTTVLIVTGIGVFAVAIQRIAMRSLERDANHLKHLADHMSRSNETAQQTEPDNQHPSADKTPASATNTRERSGT